MRASAAPQESASLSVLNKPFPSRDRITAQINREYKGTELARFLSNNRNRLGKVLNEMGQFQTALKIERQKIPNILGSKHSFQQTVYDKYRATQTKENERLRNTYQVNVTTKDCSLTDPRIEYDKVSEARQRLAKGLITISTKNDLMILKSSEEANAVTRQLGGRGRVQENRLSREAPAARYLDRSNDREGSLDGGSPTQQVRLKKVATDKYVGEGGLLREITAKVSRAAGERKPSRQPLLSHPADPPSAAFVDRFNAHLFQNMFFYNAKLNRKKRTLEAIKAHPKLVQFRDRFGHQAIHYAAKRGFHTLTKILISMGADIDSADGLKQTPIGAALVNNDLQMIRVSSSAVAGQQCKSVSGPEFSQRDQRGRSPTGPLGSEGEVSRSGRCSGASLTKR